MRSLSGQFGGGNVVSDQLCLIYDTESGAILQHHRAVTFEGGKTPSTDEMAEFALEHARRRLQDNRTIDVLHVNPTAFQRGRRYRVDHKKKALISDT